jgi:hypothetical protein
MSTTPETPEDVDMNERCVKTKLPRLREGWKKTFAFRISKTHIEPYAAIAHSLKNPPALVAVIVISNEIVNA